jgi:hypothetical protein
MDDLAGEIGTGFAGMVAECHHVIKGVQGQLLDQRGLLVADIHPGLRHDPDGIRIEPMLDHPGGIGRINSSVQVPGPAFGHLAAAGVPGTEKKDGGLAVVASRHDSVSLPVLFCTSRLKYHWKSSRSWDPM